MKDKKPKFIKFDFFPKNKRAWIRIIEAVVAILLIIGVLLVVINKGYLEKKDISLKVYEIELSILKEIQLNDTLRNDTLHAEPLPIEWDDSEFPLSVKNKIISRTPNYLECEARLCEMNDTCGLNKNIDKNIYAQAVAITIGLESEFNPRQLKLFCWIGIAPGIEEPPAEDTCEDAGGECKTNSCDTYSDCTSLTGTCTSGYCCSGTCVLKQASITLLFSDVVSYEQESTYYYNHTRIFTETNGINVTLTKRQSCLQSEGCGSNETIDYRIEGELIQLNKKAWTTFSPEVFTLKHWGIDDNGYNVYVEQSMCVQGELFYPNSQTCP